MQSFSQEIFNLYVPSPRLISGLTVCDRSVGDVTIVDVSGPLTRGFGLHIFDEQVRRLVKEGASSLAINLERVSEIDSSGFGALAAA